MYVGVECFAFVVSWIFICLFFVCFGYNFVIILEYLDSIYTGSPFRLAILTIIYEIKKWNSYQ